MIAFTLIGEGFSCLYSIPLSIPNLKRYDDKGKDTHFNVPNLLCMGLFLIKDSFMYF